MNTPSLKLRRTSKKILLLVLILDTCVFNLHAQLGPEITSWILNNTGATGYAGIPSNIQQVQYSTANVYVSASCIPGYDIGPWQGNPNIPANQNFVYKITRTPQHNTGNAVNTPLGHIGVWTNGVSIFNAKDANSYMNQGVWNQNAIVVEGASFDSCLGHPAPNGEYHHHLNPRCLYDDADSMHHSPIIGYAFDGFPIYGAYGYADSTGTSLTIKRMSSSYHSRTMSVRDTLPDGTLASSAGPNVSGTYPIGYYCEDFKYISHSGNLDSHNGRWCVTPDYPAGTYAYFVTIDATLTATYPYTLGLTYYGTVPAGNTGPGGGHNTITESVTTYTSVNEVAPKVDFNLYPNPTADFVSLYVNPTTENNFTINVYNISSELIYTQNNIQPAVQYSFDFTDLPEGMYLIRITGNGFSAMKKVTVLR